MDSRDPFWAAKQSGMSLPSSPPYTDIHMPKDTPMAIYIAACAFTMGFAIIWHIFWLAAVTLLALVALVIARLSSDETSYYLPADVIAKIEAEISERKKRS